MAYPRSLIAVIGWVAIIGCVHAVTLEVREGNSTCIKAELSASLSIPYNTSSETKTVTLPLPESTTIDTASSSCGSDGSSPWLVGVFGVGHTLGLGFTTNGSLYSIENLTLQYNLSDATIFPDANSSDVVTVVSSSVGISARINTTYRCLSPATVRVGEATVTFTDMRMEAFMPGNDLSPNESVCAADEALSTTAPPPPVTTTVAPVPVPTPSPTPAGPPERVRYQVTDRNGTVCFLAQMGLQLNISFISQNKTVQEIVNLSNETSSTGSCGPTNTTLVLTQPSTSLTFVFTLNSTSKRYHLSGLALVAAWPDMPTPLVASNYSLDYLETALGLSYMCSATMTLPVVAAFSLNVYRLQVQPFAVSAGKFATAEECELDQDQMLIPIIVGASLAGLVLIVLIAYLIGRKRSHAGYQTI